MAQKISDFNTSAGNCCGKVMVTFTQSTKTFSTRSEGF